MRQEFKILARVMSESLPQQYPYSVAGGDETIMREDFDDRVDVVPVSNPNVFSQSQRIVLAQTKLQLATQAPELHNMGEVFRDMYEAMGVTDVDRILKSAPTEEPQPTDPASENIAAMDMLPLTAFEGQNHQAHIMSHLVFGSTPLVAQVPKIAMDLQKHIMEHVKLAAQEQAMVQMSQQGQGMDEAQMHCRWSSWLLSLLPRVCSRSSSCHSRYLVRGPIRWSSSRKQSFSRRRRKQRRTISWIRRSCSWMHRTKQCGRAVRKAVGFCRNVDRQAHRFCNAA